GPISRSKFTELLQQFLDTLDYPVHIDSEVVSFPQPVGSAERVTELRDEIAKKFRGTLNDLFSQFCPSTCLMADFSLDTEPVNEEEAQYGSTGEYVDGEGVAVRIRNISATILTDDSLSPEERNSVLEMAKL